VWVLIASSLAIDSPSMPRMGLLRNYHTHTWRCQHATGEAINYAHEAVAAGMEVLGFSDHTALPDHRWANVRMRMDQLDEYEAAVRAAAEAHPSLHVLLGMECEFQPEFAAFYRDELLGRRGYDYLIGAGHYIKVDDRWLGSFDHARAPEQLRIYVDLMVATIESGLFTFIAHPDVFGCCNPLWNADCAAAAHDLCAAAAATNTPLELNAYGIRKPWVDGDDGPRPAYPWPPFWAIAAEHGVRVVFSSDAHRPQDVSHGATELAAIRDQFGLTEVDVLDLLVRT
jgi:histidinol-phosphatase (PHP family)